MKKLLDGKKNAVLLFSGNLDVDSQHFDGSDLEGEPTKLKLEAVLYSVQKELVISFDDISIPLSGRGKLDFEQFHSLPVNSSISLSGSGLYLIMFDLEKIQ